MIIISPGHIYGLQEYDSKSNSDYIQTIRFMKRIGDKYPGNQEPAHSGTNCQEVLRIEIDRAKYLYNQKPCEETKQIISLARGMIKLFENRAMREKGFEPYIQIWPIEIEELIPCRICGHIFLHDTNHSGENK